LYERSEVLSDITRARALSVAVAWVAFFMTSLVRENWVVLLPFARIDLSLTGTEAGLFMTAFFVSYVVMQLPGGFLADRYSPNRILGLAQISMGAITMLLGWVNSIGQGLLLRFLAGIAAGLIFGPGLRATIGWGEQKNIGSLLGFYMAAPSVCLAIMGVVFPPFVVQYGWRYVFILTGVAATLAGVVCVCVPDNARNEGGRSAAGMRGILRTFWDMLRNRKLLSACLGGTLGALAAWGVAVWLLDYLLAYRHLGTTYAGMIFASFSIASITGRPLGGRLSDITGRRRLTVSLGLFIFFVASMATTVVNDLISLAVISSVLGIMSGFWISPFYVMIVQLGDPNNAGATSSLVNTLTRIGVAAAPVAFGYVLDQTGSYDYAMLTMSFAAVLAIPLLAPIRERHPAR